MSVAQVILGVAIIGFVCFQVVTFAKKCIEIKKKREAEKASSDNVEDSSK